jgi:hypothetical protein
VSNCFCADPGAEAVSDFDGGAACKLRPNKHKLAIAEARSVNFEEVIIFSLNFILVSLIQSSFHLPAASSTAAATAATSAATTAAAAHSTTTATTAATAH